MDLRYYFITDQIKNGKVRVAYCPTDDMIGDFMTKPLQGSKFNKFQGAILNLPGAEKIPAPGEIHVNNFLPIPGQECVEASGGTRLNGTGHEHGRCVKVKFPDDREWHQAVGRPKRPDYYKMQIQHVGKRPESSSRFSTRPFSKK